METPTHPIEPPPSNTVRRILLGCGVVFLACAAFAVGCLFLAPRTEPEPEKTPPPDRQAFAAEDVTPEALQYMRRNQLLGEDEEVISYYGATKGLEDTDVVILTDQRLVFRLAGKVRALPLGRIASVDLDKEQPLTSTITVTDAEGGVVRLDVGAVTNGRAFTQALLEQWRHVRQEKPSPSEAQD